MDWETLVSIFGQIATLASIILVFLTLNEMKNQRKASQKPDLILPKSTIYGYAYGYEGKDTLLIASEWSDDKELQDNGNAWSQVAPIKLYNVGFGVAKNIEIKWTVDYDKTIQQIKDYCYKNSVPIIIQLDKNGLSVVDGVGYSPDDYSISDNTFAYDFLMPASIASEGLGSFVPIAIRELISILVHLKTHYRRQHLNENSQLEIDLPSMRLELTYDDLENSHYSKRFDVVFSIPSYSTLADEGAVRGLVQLFSGSFEFKSKPKR